jgi:hypothetical protein
MSCFDRKRPHQICRGRPRPAGLHAFHERVTDAEGADAECVPRNAQPLRHQAAVLDPPPLRVLVDQIPLVRRQLRQAPLETVEPFFSNREVFVGLDPARRPRQSGSLRAEAGLCALAPKILEQDESCHHVTVARRRCRLDNACLFKRPADAVECFVCQIVGCRTISPLEVRDQTAAHFDIPLSVGVDAVVQPREQPAEREGGSGRLLSRRFLHTHLHGVLLSAPVLAAMAGRGSE